MVSLSIEFMVLFISINATCYDFFVVRYVASWIEKREVQSEKANLLILFEKFVPIILEAHKVGKFKKITPVQEVGYDLTLHCQLK